MGEAALRLVYKSEYTNAGTVEFILDRDRMCHHGGRERSEDQHVPQHHECVHHLTLFGQDALDGNQRDLSTVKCP